MSKGGVPPNRILHRCALRAWGLTSWENCRHVAINVVAVCITCSPGDIVLGMPHLGHLAVQKSWPKWAISPQIPTFWLNSKVHGFKVSAQMDRKSTDSMLLAQKGQKSTGSKFWPYSKVHEFQGLGSSGREVHGFQAHGPNAKVHLFQALSNSRFTGHCRTVGPSVFPHSQVI